jgi:4-amino-4-deoxy-L-arabinose transferase-like glycosyltransferase
MLDIPLLLFLIMSHRYLYRFIQNGKVQPALVAGVFLGLGFLTKGFMGLAIPLTTVFVYLLSQKKTPWQVSPKFGQAFIGLGLVALLVGGIWLVPQFIVHGKDFGQLLYRENIERFFHPIDETGGERQVSSETQRDPHLNILYLFLGFLPWSPLIIPAIWQLYKEKYWGQKDVFIFLLSWLFIYLLLSSLSGHYKGPRYLLPLFPPLAILVGAYLERWLYQGQVSFKRGIVWGYTLCTIVFVLLITYVLATHFPHGEDQYKPVVIPMLLLLGLTYGLSWYFWKKNIQQGFSYILASIFMSYTGMVLVAMIFLPKILPEIALSKYYRAQQHQPVVWQMKIRALDLYVGRSVKYISRPDELGDLPQGTILLSKEKGLKNIEKIWSIEKKESINDWSAVVLKKKQK